MGWRMRILVVLALLGCVALFSILRWLAASPTIPGQWKQSATAQQVLTASDNPALQAQMGQTLHGIRGIGDQHTVVITPVLRSARWTPSDDARAQATAQARALTAVLVQPRIELVFDNGGVVQVACLRYRRCYGCCAAWLCCCTWSPQFWYWHNPIEAMPCTR
jgi:hypothetical protein